MKRCCTCKKQVPLSEFYKCKALPDGLQLRCKTCITENRPRYRAKVNEYYRKKYQTNKERHNGYVKNWAEKNKGKQREIFKRYMKRQIEGLTDVYIKYLLKKSGLTQKQIDNNPELITRHRQELLIKRGRWEQQRLKPRPSPLAIAIVEQKRKYEELAIVVDRGDAAELSTHEKKLVCVFVNECGCSFRQLEKLTGINRSRAKQQVDAIAARIYQTPNHYPKKYIYRHDP